MTLTDLRQAVAAALSTIPQVSAGEWSITTVPVDAIQPPAFALGWGPNPWRQTATVCADYASLEVVVVAGRLTPEGVYPILETMVDAACNALASARLRSPQTLAPAAAEFGNITYLTARIQVRQPVEVAINA